MDGVDESVLRNLDTQHRRLTEVETDLDRLLSGAGTAVPSPGPPGPARYDELTATNDALRTDRGWGVVDLDAALTAELRAEFERWRSRQRVRWVVEDVVAVAVAGWVGAAATWFDSAIDLAAKSGLRTLRDTPLITRWEREAKGMPIDYMRSHVGGPGHRLQGAGHDIGRPFEALRQIRDGTFRGTAWVGGERTSVTVPGFRPVPDLGEALTLWGKHLVADVITPMSLPLPGWSTLYELPSETLSTFARQTYGAGANLRSGASSTLPVLTTEVVVRTHVHGRAMLGRGSAVLTAAETSLRTELLLAGHSLVGAVSLGRAVTLALLATPAAGFVHVNWPVLMRAAMLSLQVVADARARRSPARTWEDLLSELAEPWHLDTAGEVDAQFG